MFFHGTSVLEENKMFQCQDAKAYITTKTNSDFVIILSILLACYISEGFVRNATQWQAELCLWKINYFDWIFKRHFNMVPIAHHLRGLKRIRAQHFPFSKPRKYLRHCRKLVHCICKHSFQVWKKEDPWPGLQPSFPKYPSLSIHITQSSQELPNQGHNSAYRCIGVNFLASCPIEIIDHP